MSEIKSFEQSPEQDRFNTSLAILSGFTNVINQMTTYYKKASKSKQDDIALSLHFLSSLYLDTANIILNHPNVTKYLDEESIKDITNARKQMNNE